MKRHPSMSDDGAQGRMFVAGMNGRASIRRSVDLSV